VWSSPPGRIVISPKAALLGTPPGARSRFLAALTAVVSALGALAWSASATADSSAPRHDAIKTVSYSTGEAGHKLKWLPYRSPEAAVQGAVVQAQGIAASSDDPFKNPFGDPKPQARANPSATAQAKRAEPPATLPAPALSDKILNKLPPEPTPGKALPPLSVDEPAPRVKSPREAEEIRVPSFGPELAAKPVADVCPSLEELELKPINKITNDITAKGEKFPTECPLKSEIYRPRSWSLTTFTWKASGLCHHPAYFDEVHLERYGHSLPCGWQPLASAAHFFLIVPALPYAMAVCPPNECVYSLGYYRPGSCAPYLLDPLPLSVRGALAEGGVWTGMVFLIP